MRETVVVQVGQCGNQIGNQFWKQLLLEHEKTPDEEESLSSFFRYYTLYPYLILPSLLFCSCYSIGLCHRSCGMEGK